MSSELKERTEERSLPMVEMTRGSVRDDKKGSTVSQSTNSSLNPKTRLDVGSAKAETTNSLNSLFVKIRVIRGQTLLFIPIRRLDSWIARWRNSKTASLILFSCKFVLIREQKRVRNFECQVGGKNRREERSLSSLSTPGNSVPPLPENSVPVIPEQYVPPAPE
jgi:hypothetical protein